jgi:hypothetical protein
VDLQVGNTNINDIGSHGLGLVTKTRAGHVPARDESGSIIRRHGQSLTPRRQYWRHIEKFGAKGEHKLRQRPNLRPE